jgi:hypothetical protein
MVRERHISERKVRCDGERCPQYADYDINGRVKQFKLCRYCMQRVVTDMCEYGFIRRAANKVIEEKGV